VKFVFEQIICRHGCPKIIQSDNGSIFTSDFFAAVTEKIGIEHKLSTTFHPQSQGRVERTHAVINDCISMFVNQNKTNWCERLHLITFAINTSVSTATGFTPFFLLHGRQARLPSEAQLYESNYADLDSLLD
jgi:transposase InsO family protein